MLEGPASTIVATVDGAGRPHATRAWGTWSLRDGTRVRFLLPAADERAFADIAQTGRVALTATVVDTLRSVQVKGVAARVEGPATADDRLLHERYATSFFRTVHDTDGSSIDALQHMLPPALVAVECEVDAVFDQTPGPTAGAPLS